MLKKINLMIAKFGIWIFVCAALYRFTFWIINMVNGYKISGGYGVRVMFSDLFDMLFYLVMLAVILEVSRKIAEKYTPEELAPKPVTTYQNNYAAPQAPAQPQMQVPPQAPVQPAAPAPAPAQPAAQSVWYCSGCGTQNVGEAAFCAKCGKPK